MRRGDDRIAIDGVGQWSSAIKGGSAKRHWTVHLSAATKPTTTTHCRRCVHADSVCWLPVRLPSSYVWRNAYVTEGDWFIPAQYSLAFYYTNA